MRKIFCLIAAFAAAIIAASALERAEAAVTTLDKNLALIVTACEKGGENGFAAVAGEGVEISFDMLKSAENGKTGIVSAADKKSVSKNADLIEYSFEGGRPDTLTAEKLALIRSFGIDRISVNPQTTNDRALRAIGRKHTTEQFYAAAELAMKQGFRSVNADLIAGLPEDTFDDFAKSIEDVTALGFDNVTVHSLSIKNAAELKNDGDSFDPVGSLARRCVAYAHDELAAKGLESYYLYRQKRTVGNGENTGYALPGRENLYNVMMMEEFSTVFACGAGAITKLVSPEKDKIERIAFQKYPFEYLSDDNGIGGERAASFFGRNV